MERGIDMDKIYDIRVIDRLGEEHSMSEYRGKLF